MYGFPALHNGEGAQVLEQTYQLLRRRDKQKGNGQNHTCSSSRIQL